MKSEYNCPECKWVGDAYDLNSYVDENLNAGVESVELCCPDCDHTFESNFSKFINVWGASYGGVL